VTDDGAADVRSAALEAYLAKRGKQGFRVETQTGTQAVIIRRHPLHFLLRHVARGMAEQRLVVSVDEHGTIAAHDAEPLRW
jgi:hypothetical protein